jgi:hypothetical protein
MLPTTFRHQGSGGWQFQEHEGLVGAAMPPDQKTGANSKCRYLPSLFSMAKAIFGNFFDYHSSHYLSQKMIPQCKY